MNLENKRDVLRFCELRQREMVRCFERLGRYECNGYSFGAYVFATHEARELGKKSLDGLDWKTGKKLAEVKALPCHLPRWVESTVPHRQHTALFGATLRSYTKLTRAIGTLIMSEAWHVHVEAEPGKSSQEIRDQYPEDLAEAPERKERLFMQLEHSATGRVVWFADIERHPTALGPWQAQTFDDVTGRLVDLAAWRS